MLNEYRRRGGIFLAVAAGWFAIPASAGAQDATAPTTVDASRGGVTFSSGMNSLTIGARMQFRWTADNREQGDTDTIGAGLGRADGTLSQFDVPRLRVTLSGGVYRPWLRYQFQFDFSRTNGEGDSKIKDAVIEIRPTDQPYRMAFGQFKVPFGLQQLTSSGRLQLVDRAITDNKFAPGREMGALFAGTVAASRVGYEVGAFNASGESIRQNNRGHIWAARAFFNPSGTYALSEGSIDAADRTILHIGIAVRGGEQMRGRSTIGGIEEPDNQRAVGLELAAKLPRLYSTIEYFWMTDEQQNPAPGPDITSRGFHAQAGYMIVPRLFEAAFRISNIDGDTEIDDAAVTEVRGGIGYFWRVHNLKVQVDAGRLNYGRNFQALSLRARSGLPALGPRLVTGEALADNQVRAQLQVAF